LIQRVDDFRSRLDFVWSVGFDKKKEYLKKLISNLDHLSPLHKTGRGAGGICFIKDFAAFSRFFNAQVKDPTSRAFLHSLEAKNLSLLQKSGKDLDIIRSVYGKRSRRTRS